MAVTKIKPIRGTVSKAIAYILDPQKTDDAFYVSSYGCAASDAAAKEFEWTRNLAVQQGMQMPKVLARHLIQSFDIGEATPEEAHEVGKQLADEWLKGKYEYVIATHIDKGHCHNHIIFNAVNYVDFHAYRSNKRTYRELRQLSDEICKEHGLDYDDFLRLMQEAGYEIKTGKYISFRAEGQERFTRSKAIGENYTEERIKERIAGRTPRRNQRQAMPNVISLIGDIQERIRLIDSKGYEYKAKLTILKEAARTLNYLTENNLLQYADLEKKVEDVHGSYDRTGKELKGVEAQLREVQPLIKNISNYQRLKPVYDAFQKAKDKPGFKAKHEAELVIFEAARSTLLAMQGDEKLPSLKTLQAEQQRLLDEQQRLYDERARLKKEARMIDTMKANVDDFLKPVSGREQEQKRSNQIE